jgi:hypothetical protein
MFKNITIFSNSPEKIQTKGYLNLQQKFKKTLEVGGEITPKDIINFLIYLMQFVENYNTNGSNKKEIVLNIIKDIVLKYKNNIPNVEHMENFIKTVLPSLIDIIISLDKKQIYIKLENAFENKCYFV